MNVERMRVVLRLLGLLDVYVDIHIFYNYQSCHNIQHNHRYGMNLKILHEDVAYYEKQVSKGMS